MATASVTQVNVRIYADDNADVDSCTALAAQNATLTRQTGTANRFIARVLVQNGNAALWNSTTQWQYQNVTQSTGWQTLNASSSHVRTTGGLPDEATAIDTNLITGGTGTFETDGVYNESTGTISPHVSKNNYAEFAICCYLVATDVNHNDTIELRLSGAAVTAWNNYPTLTVNSAQTITLDGAVTVTATVAATMLEGRVIDGAVTVGSTVASTMTYSAAAAYTIAGAVTVGVSVAASAPGTTPNFMDEGFEGTGYEESWSGGESVGAGCTLDEDYPTSSLTSPPWWWGSQCLEMVHAASQSCYVNDVFTNQAVSYSRVEFMVDSAPAVGTTCGLFFIYDNAGTNELYKGEVYNNAGQLQFILWPKHDGTGTPNYSVNISAGTYYRVEVYWNSTADEWAWRFDGADQNSGSLTGSAVNWSVGQVFLGGGSGNNGAATVYYDKFGIDTTGWIGPGGASGMDYTRNASIAGAVSVTASVASTMVYEGAGAAITGAVTVGVDPTATALDYTRNAALTGAVTVGVDPTATALSYNRNAALTGAVTVDSTVAATLSYNRNADLAGTITVGVDPSASALTYNRNASVDGSVTVGVDPTATLAYNRNADLTGSVTVGVDPTATDLSYNRNASIAGAVTVDSTVSAAFQYARQFALAASVLLTLTPSATMLEGRTLDGSVTVTPSIAATMEYAGENLINGSVTVTATPAATMLEGRALAGDVTVTPSVAASLDYTQNLSITGAVTVEVIPSYGVAPPAILDNAIAWWHADTYDPDTDGQSWPDQSGNGHHAQLGSSTGADTNDPLFLPYDGTQYLYCPYDTTTDRGISVPNMPVLTGGDLEIIVDAALNDWEPVAYLVRKLNAAANMAYALRYTTKPILYWHDGTSLLWAECTVVPGFTDGTRKQLRVTLDTDNGSGAYEVKFYARDPGDSWSQLGSTVTGGTTTSYVDDDATKKLSLATDNSANFATGKYYGFVVSDEIGSASPEVDIDLTDEANVLPGSTGFTDNAGNSVSIWRGDRIECVVVNRNLWLLSGDDYFEVADHDDLDFNDEDQTWYQVFRKITNYTAATTVWLSKCISTSSDFGYYGYISSVDQYNARIATSGVINADNTLGELNSLEHGWGAVVDQVGNTIEAFRNGIGTDSPGSINITDIRNSDPLRFGATAASTPASYAKGALVGVALFRSALSDADMATLDTALKGSIGAAYNAFEYNQNPSIAGDVTVTATVAATMLEGRVLAGDVAVTPTVASTMSYTSGNEIVGDITVVATPAATLDYTLNAALTGDITVGIAVSSGMLEGRGIIGAVTVTPTIASALDYTLNASIAGDITVGVDPTASALLYNINKSIDGDVTVTPSVSGIMLEGRVLDGAVTVAATPASTMSYSSGYTIAGDVTVDIAVASTMLEGRVIAGAVTVTVDPTASAILYSRNYLITGDTTVGITVASGMTYESGKEIVGAVTVDVTPAASLAYNTHQLISGDTTVTIAIDGSPTYAAADEIVGSITVTITPASTLDYTRNADITGDVTVGISVNGEMLEGRVLDGAVTVVPTISSGMEYSSHSTIAGDVTVNISVSSGMAYTSEGSINGDVTVTITVASGLDYTLTRSIVGDITVTPTISAEMLEGRGLEGSVTVATTISSSTAYNRNASISGDITVTPVIASSMIVRYVYSIDGGVAVVVSIDSATNYTFIREIAGDITVGISVNAIMVESYGKVVWACVAVDSIATSTVSLAAITSTADWAYHEC